jgi:hypothetical protein
MNGSGNAHTKAFGESVMDSLWPILVPLKGAAQQVPGTAHGPQLENLDYSFASGSKIIRTPLSG